MPQIHHILKHVQIQQSKILDTLLPDICQIYPTVGLNKQISGGILTYDQPEPRQWVNPRSGLSSSNIPCSVLIERAFVPDKLHDQATTVSRNVLSIPSTMRYDDQQNPNGVRATDRVVVNGRKYEIRKISDQSAYDAVLELTIVEISTEYDHP